MSEAERLILLLHFAISEDPYFRRLARRDTTSTEEIILTAKAMDFIEGLIE